MLYGNNWNSGFSAPIGPTPEEDGEGQTLPQPGFRGENNDSSILVHQELEPGAQHIVVTGHEGCTTQNEMHSPERRDVWGARY